MKNKSVQNCQFVHYANFHCSMTRLNRLFKIEFERGELEKNPTLPEFKFGLGDEGCSKTFR